ncbi:MAG: TIM barrel protein [Planctomycetota bacterium]
MLIIAHLDQPHRREEWPKLFAQARAAGFDGVEVVIGDGYACAWSEPEEAYRTLAQEADRCGTPVRSVFLADDPAVRIGIADDAQRAQNLERVRAGIERCRWLGAALLRWIPGAVGPTGDGQAPSYQDALNYTCFGIEALRADFERCGVAAGLIPCYHRFLLSPPEFRELIDRLNSPRIDAALDYAACAQVGEPADWIATLQHRLAAVSMRAAASFPTVGAGSLIVRGESGQERCDTGIQAPAETQAGSLCHNFCHGLLIQALRHIRFDGLWIHMGELCGPGELNALRQAMAP